VGAAKFAHRFGAAALPLVRNPEIEMCGGVRVVDGQRGLIVGDGIIDGAVFEQQIAGGHERRDAARVGLERRSQRGDGRLAIAAPQVRKRALVVHEGSF
jgi:hypothetical protein